MQSLSLFFQMFIIFYSIPFVPWVSTLTLYSIYASFMIFFRYRIEFKSLLSYMQKDCKLFTVLGFYIIFICILNLMYNTVFDAGVIYVTPFVKTVYQYIVRTVMSFLCAAYLAIICIKRKISFDKLMHYFVVLACIQFVFVVATYVSPMIKGVILEYIENCTKQTSRIVELLSNSSYIKGMRMFGLAGDYFESYAFICTMFFMAAIYLGYKCNGLYFLLMLFPIFSTAVNSRTGLVLCAISSFYMVVKTSLRNGRYMCRGLALILFLVVLAPFLVLIFLQNNSATYMWLQEGISSIFALRSGIDSTTGSLRILLTSHVVFPDNIFKLIFGGGYAIAVPGIVDVNSDIGYINVMWACGLVGSFMIYYIHFSFFTRAYKLATGQITKAYVLGVAIAFFLLHYKITNLGSTPAVIATYFIMLYVYAEADAVRKRQSLLPLT